MAPGTILIFLLAITGFCIAEDEEELCPWSDEEERVYNECGKEIKSDFSAEASWDDTEYFTEKEWETLAKCYVIGMKMVSESGEFSEEVTREMIQKTDTTDDIKEGMTAVLNQCIKDFSSDGFGIAACFVYESDKICNPGLYEDDSNPQ